jgi:putative ribosome biogenesis GTPase RsgA
MKIILLGDSAVGKSKLMERFLLDDYVSHQDSTYALTLYRYTTPHPTLPQSLLNIDFWDTAGYRLLTQPRTVPEHASVLLHGLTLLYPCIRCNAESHVQEPRAVVYGTDTALRDEGP